jgi:hypothetical protein
MAASEFDATKVAMHIALRQWLKEYESGEEVVAVFPQKKFTRKQEEMLLTPKEAAEIALAASAYVMNQYANEPLWMKAKKFSLTVVEKAQELKINALEDGDPGSPTFSAKAICEGLECPENLKL